MAMVVKRTPAQKIFDAANYIFLFCLIIITIYPVVYVISASLSDPNEVMKAGGLMAWPRGLTTETYGLVFKNRSILTGYGDTIFYVVVGTSLNLILTIFGAYGLSRKGIPGTGIIMMLILFTMFFRGGMIPEFLINKSLGIYDNRFAVILPYAISVYNLIFMRTFFSNIPASLEES